MIRVRYVMAGALVAHCVLGVLQERAHSGKDVSSLIEDLTASGRSGHRTRMLFPLLLGISARLAALVPTFFLGVFGIFVFVAFSKKALIISLFALLLSYIDRHRHKPRIVHIHHSPSDFGTIEHSPPSFHSSPPRFFDYTGRKPFRKWPKIDHGPPWPMIPTAMDSPMDSYLPQASRRIAEHIYLTPQLAYSPPVVRNNNNSSEKVNSSVVSPDLQKFIETAIEDVDPR